MRKQVYLIRDGNKFKTVNADYVIYCETESMFSKVKQFAKKQEPKACKYTRDVCHCGSTVFPYMNYCTNCGQALKWDKV